MCNAERLNAVIANGSEATSISELMRRTELGCFVPRNDSKTNLINSKLPN